MDKLGGCKGTQSEDGRFCVLTVGIYLRTAVKAAKVLVQRRDIRQSHFKLTPGLKLWLSKLGQVLRFPCAHVKKRSGVGFGHSCLACWD